MSGAGAIDISTASGGTLAGIAAGAAGLDRDPAFPAEAFESLEAAGALRATVNAVRNEDPVADTWTLVRAVAAADASVGRIFDGHLNAVERLEVSAEPAVRDRELARVAGEGLILGVWGADPALSLIHI